MKKATRQQSKKHNRRLVLRTIYQYGEISRADIARQTHLTRPTVSGIVTDLIDAELVVETGQGPSAGGKRPLLLAIAADANQLISIDLSSRVFRGAVVNLRGDILTRLEFPTNNQKGTAALALTYKLIDALAAAATAPLLGIGIGTPGLVDPQQGLIMRAVNMGWQDLLLRELIEARTGWPVYVANDCHAAALAEYTFGRQTTSKNLVVIKVGVGIAAGIVLDGRSYYGDGFGAGEIGHVVVAEQGELCACGNVGCLEKMAGTQTILQKAQLIAANPTLSDLNVRPDVTWETIVAALEAKEPATIELIENTGKYLGVAIANLIGSLNIRHIVIAGRVTRFGDVLLNAARQETQRRVLPTMAAQTAISLSALGDDIVILGGTAMVLQRELGII
ncbi:MAG: ROK family transcriptional regulator [Anaerolineales bacterium]|nr:ROK family transcriptional regulator [Anaerolineales bacterium]